MSDLLTKVRITCGYGFLEFLLCWRNENALENEVTNQWAKFLVPKFEELTTFSCFMSFCVSKASLFTPRTSISILSIFSFLHSSAIFIGKVNRGWLFLPFCERLFPMQISLARWLRMICCVQTIDVDCWGGMESYIPHYDPIISLYWRGYISLW